MKKQKAIKHKRKTYGSDGVATVFFAMLIVVEIAVVAIVYLLTHF